MSGPDWGYVSRSRPPACRRSPDHRSFSPDRAYSALARLSSSSRLGALFGLEIPPCGLVRLVDDTLAFVVARSDRLPSGRKVRQEDFCQLAQLPAKERYRGSAELCARIIRAFSDQPIVDLRKLYRQLVMRWWAGNNDLHLKNLSLIALVRQRAAALAA